MRCSSSSRQRISFFLCTFLVFHLCIIYEERMVHPPSAQCVKNFKKSHLRIFAQPKLGIWIYNCVLWFLNIVHPPKNLTEKLLGWTIFGLAAQNISYHNWSIFRHFFASHVFVAPLKLEFFNIFAVVSHH